MRARSDQRRAAKGGSGQRAQSPKRQKGAGLRLCSSHVLHHKETSNLIGAQVSKKLVPVLRELRVQTHALTLR